MVGRQHAERGGHGGGEEGHNDGRGFPSDRRNPVRETKTWWGGSMPGNEDVMGKCGRPDAK